MLLFGGARCHPARILGCAASLVGLPLLLVVLLSGNDPSSSNPFIDFAQAFRSVPPRCDFLITPPSLPATSLARSISLSLHPFLSIHPSRRFWWRLTCKCVLQMAVFLKREGWKHLECAEDRRVETMSVVADRHASIRLVFSSAYWQIWASERRQISFRRSSPRSFFRAWNLRPNALVAERQHCNRFNCWNAAALPATSNGYIRVDCYGGLNQMRRDVSPEWLGIGLLFLWQCFELACFPL